jgi:2-succinyl-5-enolpyruvyl-6-hydroxy-3-cyclohexene-1-carboxylate synthase
VLLIGDVALAHDVGGLLAARRLGLRLAIVLLHNDGGGIFDFLPVASAPIAREPDAYTEHVATPHDLDFAHAAELYGCRHERAADVPGLRAALERALGHDGTAIVEVRTDRLANLQLHRQLWNAVADAVRDPR